MTSPQGLTVLSAPDYSKPWLISGSGRSGTTALALVIQELGLPLLAGGMGNLSEHAGMHQAYLNRDLTWIRAFHDQWRAGHVVKTPILGVVAGTEPELAEALDCNYIFALRDPIAESYYDARQHPGANVAHLMLQRAVMAQNAVSSAITLSVSTGVLVLSYEKLIQPRSNRALVEYLCTLIGGQPSKIDDALRVINPEDEAYAQRLNEAFPPRSVEHHTE